MKKVLVIRFSSFGDVVQATTVNHQLRSLFPEAKIVWLTKSAFASLVQKDPNVDQVINLEDFSSLLSLASWIKSESFNLIYDAHKSMRSSLLFFLSKVIFDKSSGK